MHVRGAGLMVRGPKVSIETNYQQQDKFKKVPDVLVSCEKTYIYQVPKKRNWERNGRKGGEIQCDTFKIP